MKKISLSQNEIEDLKDLYQSEIDRAQRRIESLKSILKKIEKGDLDTKPEAPAKRGRKPKTAQPKPTAEAPKKRGRKPKNQTLKTEEPTIKEPKKRGRKPKAKAASATAPAKKTKKTKVSKRKTKVAVPKKRGRKPKPLRKSLKQSAGGEKVKWVDLITSIFKTNNALMQANTLTVEAMKKLGLPEVEKDRTRMAVATNLTKLTKHDKKIVKFTREGDKVAYYGLAEWFNEDGSLKNEFKERFA